MNVEYVPTIAVGGGQAGLATGRELQRRGLPFVILDASERIGDAWRRRWDSLRLFTPARWDGLPDLPFPERGDPDGEPLHERGCIAAAPGLFFVGLHFLFGHSSASLVGIGRDAKHVARAVEARVRAEERAAARGPAELAPGETTAA